jgi:undecaprenyl-diphosphatase
LPAVLVPSMLLVAVVTAIVSAGAMSPATATPQTAIHQTAIHQADAVSIEPSSSRLTAPKAIALGLVEGITEYLPVSSTGHLLVAEELLGLRDGTDESRSALDSYTVIIQLGAILAVLVLYRKRIVTIFQGLFGRSESGRALLIASVVAFIPAAVIGKGGESIISDRLLQPWPIVAAWIVGGIVILVVWPRIKDRVGVPLENITIRQAGMIGVAQAVALWPGTSRSFATILGGLLVGLSLSAAVEFSFLLGLLTLTAATAYEALRNGGTVVDQYGVSMPLLGMAVAAASAFFAVRFMVSWLNRGGFELFGWYRIGVGVLVGGLLLGSII